MVILGCGRRCSSSDHTSDDPYATKCCRYSTWS